ncbi:c-type cytochrome biogenesis protein CcsB [Pseudoclavibacter alba]|uniref:C-type cytochrome biogenesis protein CcsB n=1 Tax=Pseudoclavibacter albus TaxID=272241 RepID=A0ABT2HVN3_9MICO|nr:c-type cytochrome biogenesis protein CcsB [Pseudoclavibacter alba]MCT2042379.1 c-type cytochrome biogenesis protein CcsB [Pseudoclavibacter alba]
MTQVQSDWSNVLIYVTMAMYAIALILFSMDLANRSAARTRQRQGSALGATKRRESVTAGASAAGAASSSVSTVGTLVLERGGDAADTAADAADGDASSSELAMAHSKAGDADEWRDERASTSLRIAMALMWAGFAVHLVATVLRGLAASRVPWSNMYEFTMTSTLLVVLVFLLAQFWNDLRFLGTFISGFVTLCLGIAAVGFYVEVAPLQPALQSYWLVIHVFVASLSTGCLALGFGLSIAQLMQNARTKRIREGGRSHLGFLAAIPSEERLEDLAYRVIVVGFILWTFTLIAGAIWAERAWGRYWGWDTKEVWTFIIWTVYAGYIHARATKGWRGTPSAWLAIVGFGTVLFNFGIVNVFFKGLHTYSGL